MSSRLAAALVAAVMLSGCAPSEELVVASFVNPDDLGRISRFRSCCGHDYSTSGEKKRSMKHYLHPNLAVFGASDDELPVYAPFDGEIQATPDEQHYLPCYGEVQGQQIHVVSRARPGMYMKFFHTHPIETGPVRAGDLIGYADIRGCDYDDPSQISTSPTSFDISLEGAFRMYSPFEFMDPAVADEWIARGITDLDDLIISREQRDADPCQNFGQSECEPDMIDLP